MAPGDKEWYDAHALADDGKDSAASSCHGTGLHDAAAVPIGAPAVVEGSRRGRQPWPHGLPALVASDSFAAGGSQAAVAQMHREADRIFRSVGNRSGRQRLRPDGTLGPVRPPP
jgi:hypothetical protein